MGSILPHKHTVDDFLYNNNGENFTFYEQNINSDCFLSGNTSSNDYDLFFYMYQINAQEAIDTYNNDLPDASIGDISLMLF